MEMFDLFYIYGLMKFLVGILWMCYLQLRSSPRRIINRIDGAIIGPYPLASFVCSAVFSMGTSGPVVGLPVPAGVTNHPESVRTGCQ